MRKILGVLLAVAVIGAAGAIVAREQLEALLGFSGLLSSMQELWSALPLGLLTTVGLVVALGVAIWLYLRPTRGGAPEMPRWPSWFKKKRNSSIIPNGSSREINGPLSLLFGAVFSASVGFGGFLLTKIWPAAVAISLIVFILGLGRVSGFHAGIVTWLSDFIIKRYHVGPGPHWLPFVFGIMLYKGIVAHGTLRANESTPSYLVYMGERNLLPSELNTKSEAPKVNTREGMEIIVPLSGSFRVVNPAQFGLGNENPEALLIGKVLETLRLAVAKFHYGDLMLMKSIISGLVNGKHMVYVVRITEEKVPGTKELAGMVYSDRNRGRIFTTVNSGERHDLIPITSSDGTTKLITKEEHAKRKLLEMVSDDTRCNPALRPDNLGLHHISVIEVADGLREDMERTGTLVTSIQVRDLTPSDPRVLKEAAQRELEMLQRENERIQAETVVLNAQILAKAFDIKLRDAAQINRIKEGVTREFKFDGGPRSANSFENLAAIVADAIFASRATPDNGETNS